MSEPTSLTDRKQSSTALAADSAAVANPQPTADTYSPLNDPRLLKLHGIYQQGDRDRRNSGGKGDAKVHRMMVRTKIPGGKLTGEQFLDHLRLCDEFGDGTLRVTTRQDIQIYGVHKNDLREVVQRIKGMGLTTLGACGDVGRNIICCPAPFNDDPRHQQMQQLAQDLSDRLLPSVSAYESLWFGNGDGDGGGGGEGPKEDDSLYGQEHLPRKFKIGIALPDDNCTDVYTHDLGLLAICEGTRIVGYNVLVGGGMGMTPTNTNTFPALARPVAFVKPQQVADVALAIVEVFRDFGNRAKRRQARLKYLIADWGLGQFKRRVEDYFGQQLAPPRKAKVQEVHNHLGWHEQGDGRWFLGLSVENGRLGDSECVQWKSALEEILRTVRPNVRLTPQQNLLLIDIDGRRRVAVDEILRQHGIQSTEGLSKVRRWSMACVALPTCPLALAESERVLPEVIDALESELRRLNLQHEEFAVRMTGCPNGCARPYNADVGLVGRGVGRYAIFLGGRRLGDRLAFLYKDKVPLEQIVPVLVSLLTLFKRRRQPGETFGDFCHHQGAEKLATAVLKQPSGQHSCLPSS